MWADNWLQNAVINGTRPSTKYSNRDGIKIDLSSISNVVSKSFVISFQTWPNEREKKERES